MLRRTYFQNTIALAAALVAPALAFAQADVTPRGHGFATLSWINLDTGHKFDFLGDRTRIIPAAGPGFRGESITNVVALDVIWGVWNRVDLHVTLPYAISSQPSIQADGRQVPGQLQSPSSSGLSNVRFGGRYQVLRRPLSLTAKFDVKLSASTPDLEQLFNGTTLPIREGQTDYDFSAQASKSFRVAEHSFSVGGEGGYRYRTTQSRGALDTFTREALPVKPGDEFFYNLRIGYPIWRRFTLSFNADGIEERDYAVPFRFTRIGNDGQLKTVGTQGSVPAGFTPDYAKQSGRRIFTLGPSLTITVHRRTYLTGGVSFAAVGRNYPAGATYAVSLGRVIR